MYRQSENKLLNSNMSSMSSQYGELRPTNGSNRFRSLRHPSKFQRVSRLAFVTAGCSDVAHRRPTKLARCLAVSWADTLYIRFRGLLSPYRILPRAKFTLRPSLAFTSVTARHSSSGRQPNFAASYKQWNYGTKTKSPGQWPTSIPSGILIHAAI